MWSLVPFQLSLEKQEHPLYLGEFREANMNHFLELPLYLFLEAFGQFFYQYQQDTFLLIQF